MSVTASPLVSLLAALLGSLLVVSPLPTMPALLLEQTLGPSLPSLSADISSGSAGWFKCVAFHSRSLTWLLGFSLGRAVGWVLWGAALKAGLGPGGLSRAEALGASRRWR